MNTRAFSLMEILVTIGVIAVLATLLFPTAKTMMTSAEQTRSTTRLKNVAQAAISYGAENEGIIICSYQEGHQQTWSSLLTQEGYLPGDKRTCTELGCEVQKKQFGTTGNITFNWNGRIGNYSSPAGATRFQQLDKPSRTALVMHGIGRGSGNTATFNRGIYESSYASEVKPVFGDRVLIAFCGGNVQLVRPRDVPTSYNGEGRTFWLGK